MKFMLFRSAIGVIISAMAVSCQQQAPPVTSKINQSTQVDVCYSAVSASEAVVWYAFEKGLFKQYGLDVKLTYISSGSKATAALIANEADFCQIAGPAVVNGVVAGEDLKIIAGLLNTYLYSLVVSPKIKTPEDLRGKAVVVSQLGSASDAAMRSLLKRLRLEPDRDVAILAVGGEGERLAAMETGKVMGTVLEPPNTLEAREKGYKILVDMSSLNIPYQHTSIVTKKTYLTAHPEIAKNFMKAIVEAIARMKQDREGTIQVMAKYLLLDVKTDAASLAEAYDVVVRGYIPAIPYPTREGIQILLTQSAAENPQATKIKPEDIMDARIIQNLDQSGFIKALNK